MPGYIKKKLHKYWHAFPKRIQTCLYSPGPKTYRSNAQAPIPIDSSLPLDAKGIQQIQKIVGSILLRACSWHDGAHGIKLHCIQANDSNSTYHATMHPTPRLSDIKLRCKGQISRIQHGHEHTLQHIIPLRTTGTTPYLWTLRHGINTNKWRTNITWRSIFRQYNNNEICCGISFWSLTRSIIPKLSRWNNILSHLRKYGAPPTKNPSPLWQCNCGWYFQ